MGDGGGSGGWWLVVGSVREREREVQEREMQEMGIRLNLNTMVCAIESLHSSAQIESLQ